MSKYINEAFRQFTLLEDSEDFALTPDGIDNLGSFMDSAMNDDDLGVQVIDPEAETEDDLKQSYVGKIICDCNVCHSHIFFNKEDIVISDDGVTVNEDDECPYCMSADGYTIIGEIKPWSPELENEIEEEPSDDELANEPIELEDESESEVVEESLKLDGVEELKGVEELSGVDELSADDSLTAAPNDKIQGTEELTEDVVDVVDDAIDTVQAGLEESCDDSEKELQESIQDVQVTTEDETMTMTTKDDGGVVIETSPVEEEVMVNEVPLEEVIPDETSEEMIAPVDDETVDEIINGEETPEEMDDFEFEEEPANEEFPEEDIPVDEFDEESFDDLGEAYLRKNYDNVSGFKTTQVRVNENLLTIDGVITFKSGNQKKTNFVFESTSLKDNKFLFEGYNTQITGKNKAFKLNCSIQDKKIIPESLKYKYSTTNALNESVVIKGITKTLKRG